MTKARLPKGEAAAVAWLQRQCKKKLLAAITGAPAKVTSAQPSPMIRRALARPLLAAVFDKYETLLGLVEDERKTDPNDFAQENWLIELARDVLDIHYEAPKSTRRARKSRAPAGPPPPDHISCRCITAVDVEREP